MERRIVLFVVACAVSSLAVQAHHGISAVYDDSRRLTIEGVVRQFQFVNPHPFVLTEVKDGNGNAQEWRLEMDNRLELVQIGVTSETFKQGDRVVVMGSPARRQAHSLYVRRLDRPSDGFWYEQVGSSPRIRDATMKAKPEPKS